MLDMPWNPPRLAGWPLSTEKLVACNTTLGGQDTNVLSKPTIPQERALEGLRPEIVKILLLQWGHFAESLQSCALPYSHSLSNENSGCESCS